MTDATPAPIGADALREVLIEAQAGLEFAAARLPAQVGDFVPSHLTALKIVNAALASAAAPHDWRVSPAYGGEICANCGAVKGTRRGNAHCREVAAPTTKAVPPPAVQQGADIGPLGQRTILDAIRSAYDLGYSDARNARTHPGDSAPGYKGRDVEKDHGGALIAKLNALAARSHTAAPAAQGDVLTPEDADQLEKVINDFNECGETDVPYTALQRYAAMGYLECTHYHAMPAARAAIDAARAAKEGAKHD